MEKPSEEVFDIPCQGIIGTGGTSGQSADVPHDPAEGLSPGSQVMWH
jgi:hypothetical protein